jgi:hypothetical protein
MINSAEVKALAAKVKERLVKEREEEFEKFKILDQTSKDITPYCLNLLNVERISNEIEKLHKELQHYYDSLESTSKTYRKYNSKDENLDNYLNELFDKSHSKMPSMEEIKNEIILIAMGYDSVCPNSIIEDTLKMLKYANS